METEFVLTPEYKLQVSGQSRIGRKGYAVPKSALDPADLHHLLQELMVRPQLFNPTNPTAETRPFPVYQENSNKIYLPRFYGVDRYGLPGKPSDLQIGDDIDVPFSKTLRDYQEPIVDAYLQHVADASTCGGGILEVPCAAGKCLGINTPILMYDGAVKRVQDVRIGDVLMGDDSTPRHVLSLARGRENMYNISDTYVVNESHILSLRNGPEVVDIALLDYLALPERHSMLGYRVPVDFPETPVDKDPYEVGLNAVVGDTIPREYMCNSRRIRLQLLAGLVNGKKALLDDVKFVARSLGFSVDGTEEDDASLTYPIHVTPLGIDDYYGFEIDGNRRFVLGDFTVTHNTVMALNIVSQLKKKTLIMVHKEFLMNQWIERIQEFLPTTRIGKIQGGTFDIQDKDIVLGMIQTLYDKEYATGTFDSFGLTIIDEVHRIGSEQFSRTLFKTITPFMLGISATVDRKDKLTCVLHMFIGPKVYSNKSRDDDPVCVRAITYKSADPEFGATEYDMRGNPKFSTMITKLCRFGPRSDFIVNVIRDLLQETKNQIMILCHNRSLLTYLYDAIRHRELATVGYYVGGMKQANLRLTEDCQVVLATFAMAAEALDIKTLATLVMVTPKTDIVQSVGRILRVKHERPIIVDIVDQHDIFQSQWQKRKAFYKKCKYDIWQTDSVSYNGMNLSMPPWTRVVTTKKETAFDYSNFCVS